jgi:uncharacterized protein
MKSAEFAKKFLENNPVALAGVSRNKQKFGYKVYLELINKGFRILPINPNADTIDDAKCYKDLSELPDEVKTVIIMTPKKQTDSIMDSAIKGGIKNIWIQQKSDTKLSKQKAKDANINLITGKCIMMYAKPSGFHKFHAFVSKLFGRH